MTYLKCDALTLPSLAWDAMLLQTEVELERSNDVDLLRMIEKEHLRRSFLCRLQRGM